MNPPLTLDAVAWRSPWRARSVRDKGLLTGGLLAAAVTLPAWPGGVAVALSALAILLVPLRVRPRDLARLVALPTLSILVGVATVAVSVWWDAGPHAALTPAGIATAGRLAVRAFAATLAMFVLACSTPMSEVFSALARAGLPAPLVEIAALIYRFTFQLLASAGAVHAAQESRLGFVNRRAALRSSQWAASALFLRAWHRAQRLEVGLAGRGYTEALPTLEPPRVRSRRFLCASLALIVAMVLVCAPAWWGAA